MINRCFFLLLLLLIKSSLFTYRVKIIAVYKPSANENVIKELKSIGVNTVFLSPDINTVRAFKDAGFRVFISFPVFYDAKMILSHPELNAKDQSGISLPKISWYKGICPTIDWFRNLQLRKLSYIIRTFPADAIFLDFIRYPVFWESRSPLLIDSSFDKTSIKKFESHARIRLPLSLNTARKKADFIKEKYYRQWVSFKCHVITSFVRNVKLMISRLRPYMKLGVFVIPWKKEDYFDAIKKIAGQDIKSLGLYADYIAPMLYHKSLGNNTEWIGESIIYFRKKSGKNILPVIQSFGVKRNMFLDALRAADTVSSSSGVVIFSYRHLDKSKKLVIKRYFN